MLNEFKLCRKWQKFGMTNGACSEKLKHLLSSYSRKTMITIGKEPVTIVI
jgi:hypothetical protein